MERSRKLVLTNWTKANDALQKHFDGNKSGLAKERSMSRTTVTAFFNCEPVREAEFRRIAFALYLDEKDWQIASDAAIAPTQNENDWIEEVRSRCCQKILYQHGTIRLLNDAEIGVDQLYVDVWLLNRSPRKFQPSSTMLELFDLRNDRLGLGDRRKRNEGIKVANDETRLLILGKPGAGKTTFLKHLAVDCSNGKFQPDLIPVLIELRRIQSAEWKLLDAISEELRLENQQTQTLIEQGNLLVLMDGLDEVSTSDFRRNVQNQVRSLAQEPQHSGSRFIVTCRTQIIEVIPQGFTPVEVAEFRDEQVENFVRNWFRASKQTEADIEQQWQAFSDATKNNSALKELTVTPVLLSLMCWVFEDSGELPSQAASLYRKGIRLLLEKWNDRKEIPEWEIGKEVYRKLDPEQKEALLTEIAARKFENLENFVLFEQKDLAQQIANFLKLANAREGEAVLKAIEAQHGLLVERADELWSFSHLAFQEYFVAREMVDRSAYEPLLENIADKRWREVCLLTVNMLPNAGDLLRQIKRQIDSLIAGDGKLQQFLTWVAQKSNSVEVPCNPASIRTFYLNLFYSAEIDFTTYPRVYLDFPSLKTASNWLNSVAIYSGCSELAIDFWLVAVLANAELAAYSDPFLYFDESLLCYTDLLRCLPPSELREVVSKLGVDFPSSADECWNFVDFKLGKWLQSFKRTMIEHRNIGHDWQFCNLQKEKLRQYYDANKLLVDCLNIARNLDRNVLQEIADNLLLPIAELKRRLPDLYS